MNYFCTFFDSRYLARGAALHHSLLAQGAPFHLWILCMDDETYQMLARRSLGNVTLLTVADLEHADPRMRLARQDRSLVELYFTSKSFLCQYILDTHPEVDLLTYLDADVYFFGDPTVIRAEMNNYSVGLTPHRFPGRLKTLERYGKFNAGFVCFRRDSNGLACLAWWRDNCFAWCHDYVDNERFADQRYLDLIPERFEKVRRIEHKGINLAPWNISQYQTTWNGGDVIIDGDPLVLYHFHGLQRVGDSRYDTSSYNYKTSLSATVRNYIYRPYVDVLEKDKSCKIARSADIRNGWVKFRTLDTFLPSFLTAYRSITRLLKGLYYRSFIYSGQKLLK